MFLIEIEKEKSCLERTPPKEISKHNDVAQLYPR